MRRLPVRLAGSPFALMLAADGQAEKEEVDVARVFLHALGEAVAKKSVKVNSRMCGHVFITPEFWLIPHLTNPIGLDCVIELIGSRWGARRYQLTRHEVFKVLREGGYLLGALEGKDTRHCVLKSRRWRKPLQLHGLCIAASACCFPCLTCRFLGGAVTIKEESVDGGGK